MSVLESTNIAQYFQRALAQQHSNPVLAFPKRPDGFSDFHRYTLAELKSLADAAAAWYVANGVGPRKQGQRPLVVALCARGDIDWMATYISLVRMGHTVLITSPRLPDSTVSALAHKGHADFFICDRNLETLEMPSIPIYTTARPQQCALVAYDDLVCDPSVIDEEHDVAWTAHSSGSTGIPKLFSTTQRSAAGELGLIRTAFLPKQSDWVSSAPYNVVGCRLANFSLSKEDGALTYFDNDRVPFTADSLTEFLLDAKPSSIWGTPYSLELISTTSEGLRMLQKAENVKVFGSVMPKTVGDRLTQAGVHFGSEYGMSEGGMLLTSSLRPRTDLDWDYLMPVNRLMTELLWFKPIDRDPNSTDEQLFEIVVRDGAPNVLDDVKDAEGNFYTGDLVTKHPTKENRWRLVGRKDDQIKCYQNDRQCIVNAYDYEHKIKAGNEDVLEDVIVFGQGKDKLGVLVFAENAVGPARSWVLERVWATIRDVVNCTMKVPIEKEMIRVITGPADLPRTTKLNFIRPQVYMKYQSVIDEAYASASGASQAKVPIVPLPMHATLHAVKSR